jgi:hypothetical protein
MSFFMPLLHDRVKKDSLLLMLANRKGDSVPQDEHVNKYFNAPCSSFGVILGTVGINFLADCKTLPHRAHRFMMQEECPPN